ncbi:transcription factor Tfb4-domain-containing protein [Lasiosphaeria miniovina]|uniref:General transcription and DNA repair factor IIH subunit TFB4 n=1 Tax=Lasiosphaeria miniovina TaxID=1954250 RepID=A0AA39ZZK6_9PEZI|nr:transcription factor Tfb4-domain-containing protein [Lasiosphaeria miniovina]KAK0706514.1 transcription factor Tfb4-domain-containing protein [Lasiosphaeria miniovina]
MSAQDFVDASEHYEVLTTNDTPSLCVIVIDTNPRAWAAIANVLPLSKAVANILVFVNTHLAFNNSNQVALIAAHPQRAVWLYPTSPKPPTSTLEDVEMGNAAGGNPIHAASAAPDAAAQHSANKYPQFAQIEASLLTALRALIDETTSADIASTTTTQVSGALTLALTHINKTALSFAAARTAADASNASRGGARTAGGGLAGLHARILVVSVSDSSAAQYIPMMNAVFAAAHTRIAIDTLALRGSATFLQQASFITRGTFIHAKEPQGLLQYLMFGFGSGSAPSRPLDELEGAASSGSAKSKMAQAAGKAKGGAPTASGVKVAGLKASVADLLVMPSVDLVDFRAACFCHRNVVDTGFVCSICLSIFCEVPEGGECLTCGTKLKLGNYGVLPAAISSVLPSLTYTATASPNAKRKEKRKLGPNGEVS